MTKDEAHRKAERAYAEHCQRTEATQRALLRALLPLAEAYLKDAPSSPDNAILEDARAMLLDTGLAPANPRKRPGSAGRALHLTDKERSMVRRAISNLLSSEYDDSPSDIAALERALEKLQ